MRHVAIFAALSALALAGCRTYELDHRFVFVDDDAYVTSVDFLVASRDHTSEFVSPVTGETLEFKTKHRVKATLPDGRTLKAWRCMNFLPRGAMYVTDDEEWKILANGFSLVVYHQTEEEPPRYLEVYRGVICDTPEVETPKNDKWHEVNSNGHEYRKPQPAKKK